MSASSRCEAPDADDSSCAGAAITFLSLAVGWWLIVLGLAVGTIGLVGWIMEYSCGQHAH